MKISTFNFVVAIWCAGTAAVAGFNGVDWFIVGLNSILALGNLSLGLAMNERGQ